MSDTDQYTDVPVEPTEDSGPRSPWRWVAYVAFGIGVLIALGYGFILFYAKVLNDSPNAFTPEDLDSKLAAEASDSGPSPAPTTPPSVVTGQPPLATAAPATEPAPVDTDSAAQSAASSQWIATDASEVGYRVKEVLFGVDTTAVGRTNQVDGTMTIDGTHVAGVDFTIDVASIASDQSRRDASFRGRVMSTDEFPTATFTLTQPIDLGITPADGAEVTTQATGDLTLRGVTNPVTFEVTAKQENGLIGVQGTIPVVFNDYGIANPSNGGVQTEDNGLVEFILVFQPAG